MESHNRQEAFRMHPASNNGIRDAATSTFRMHQASNDGTRDAAALAFRMHRASNDGTRDAAALTTHHVLESNNVAAGIHLHGAAPPFASFPPPARQPLDSTMSPHPMASLPASNATMSPYKHATASSSLTMLHGFGSPPFQGTAQQTTRLALYSAAGGHHHQGTHGGFVPIMDGDNPFADLGSVEKMAVKLRVSPPNASFCPSSTSSSTLNEMRHEKEKARAASPHACTMESPFAESPALATPTPLDNGNENTPTLDNGYKAGYEATPTPLDNGNETTPTSGNGYKAGNGDENTPTLDNGYEAGDEGTPTPLDNGNKTTPAPLDNGNKTTSTSGNGNKTTPTSGNGYTATPPPGNGNMATPPSDGASSPPPDTPYTRTPPPGNGAFTELPTDCSFSPNPSLD